MTAIWARCWAAVAAAGLFAGAAAGQAGGAGPVLDGAGLFSPGAEERAARELARLRQKYGRGLVVETFAQARPGLEEADSKGKFFYDWARDRARELQVNGVYLLVCADPADKYVQAVVGTQTEKSGLFLPADGKELAARVIARLKSGADDAALADAVDFVRRTFEARVRTLPAAGRPASGRPAGPSWLGWVCAGLVLLFIAWIVVAAFRAIGGAGAPGPAGGGTGGGFLPSLLGGMFGAAAGMWLYDQFFSDSAAAQAGAAPLDTPPAESGPADMAPDTDYTDAGGGSYGDDAGGDLGGGDFGGGDFGGGEW